MTDVTAWCPDGVLPLEIWDTSVDGRTLFERRTDRDFYEVLARAIPSEPGPVVLAGGGVDRVRAAEAFASMNRPLALVDDDAFFAAAGAFAELGVTVLDAGQTSVKAVGASGRFRLARSGESSLAALVATALDAVTAERAAAILALPCAVTIDRGAILLGACSYPIEGDARRLVDDVARRARTSIRSVRLVNDAVLAAYVAHRRISEPRALVLTIGHGVGAAIVRELRESVPRESRSVEGAK